MQSFLAPNTLLVLLLIGSLAAHLIAWRRVDTLRQEAAWVDKVRSELRDALAVANAAKEEQAGRIAWLSGRLDAEAKQPDWELFESQLRAQLCDLSERVTRLPTLQEVARMQGVAHMLAEQEETARASDLMEIIRRS